ncbi:hypothetical protein WM40_02485 [Robbsia andropogonis]|uniref:Uncharacterized protein n=2 Tax=Robbsia andropogonis TaxID=28092 RepID=A0A0F5K4L4_9BURK|nr:hypothetical protein [Robbsia andropogonis]KKB64890.1 hypothetical protein WM40_02485 [Robbsia andropogonis]MCP1119146.1 hypothetical protein [Robbsia andropogonis]MCP1129003.1 hypothetical protein [Robbsia andropogonis]
MMFFGLLVSHTSVSASFYASALTPAGAAADFPARAATLAHAASPARRALDDTKPRLRIAVRASGNPAQDAVGVR